MTLTYFHLSLREKGSPAWFGVPFPWEACGEPCGRAESSWNLPWLAGYDRPFAPSASLRSA
jgi:hypothetical protein